MLLPDLNHGLSPRSHETWTGYLGWVVPARARLRQLRYVFPGSDKAARILPPR